MMYRETDYPGRTQPTDKPATAQAGAVLWLLLGVFLLVVLLVVLL